MNSRSLESPVNFNTIGKERLDNEKEFKEACKVKLSMDSIVEQFKNVNLITTVPGEEGFWSYCIGDHNPQIPYSERENCKNNLSLKIHEPNERHHN